MESSRQLLASQRRRRQLSAPDERTEVPGRRENQSHSGLREPLLGVREEQRISRRGFPESSQQEAVPNNHCRLWEHRSLDYLLRLPVRGLNPQNPETILVIPRTHQDLLNKKRIPSRFLNKNAFHFNCFEVFIGVKYS